MKMMEFIHNPLITLIELYQRTEAIPLVQRLLRICCDLIEIERDELLRNTFKEPTDRTLTYVVLFENCFTEMPLRLNILNQLTSLWNDWEQNGLKSTQIRHWQNLTRDQRYYFNKIWNIVGKFAKKNYTVDRLFDRQYQEMLQKIKMKEKIVTCLNAYCSEGIDKLNYMRLLERMQRQIDEATVQKIIVPSELETLVPFADRLSHISKSNAWMNFYINQLNGKHSLLIISIIFFSYFNI